MRRHYFESASEMFADNCRRCSLPRDVGRHHPTVDVMPAAQLVDGILQRPDAEYIVKTTRAKLNSGKRVAHSGPAKVPRPCRVCGIEQRSAREAWNHCRSAK